MLRKERKRKHEREKSILDLVNIVYGVLTLQRQNYKKSEKKIQTFVVFF
jgi:hypothetical protein